MTTKFVKLALGLPIVLCVVGAGGYYAHRVSKTTGVATGQPAATAAASTNSDNPLDTATPGETPEQRAEAFRQTLKIKVVGDFNGLPVFDVKLDPRAGESSIPFPITVDGNVYNTVDALVRELQPLIREQTSINGVTCQSLCWNPEGAIVGYDYAPYWAAAARVETPNMPASHVAYVKDAMPTPKVYAQPTTSSEVPIEVIRNVIDADKEITSNGAFPVATWKETNTYMRTIGNEEVTFIEYRGTFHISPDLEQYVGSKGGISYRTDEYEKDGQFAVVKRGNSWYIYKG